MIRFIARIPPRIASTMWIICKIAMSKPGSKTVYHAYFIPVEVFPKCAKIITEKKSLCWRFSINARNENLSFSVFLFCSLTQVQNSLFNNPFAKLKKTLKEPTWLLFRVLRYSQQAIAAGKANEMATVQKMEKAMARCNIWYEYGCEFWLLWNKPVDKLDLLPLSMYL